MIERASRSSAPTARASRMLSSNRSFAVTKSPCSAARMPAPLTARIRISGAPVADRERGLRQRAALGDRAAHDPPAPQATTSASAVSTSPRAVAWQQGGQRLSRSASSRSSQCSDIGAVQAALGLDGQRRERARVGVADAFELAALDEPLERVLAHGLEHPEPPSVAREQALVDERRDPVERVRPADRLGGLEREAAGEHAELARTAAAPSASSRS